MSALEQELAIDFKKTQTARAAFNLWPVMPVLSAVAALLENILAPTRQMVDMHAYRIVLAVSILYFIALLVLSYFNEPVKKKLAYGAKYYFAIGMVLIIWDLLTTKFDILPLPFIPGMAQILQVMAGDANMLLISTAYSMRLLIIGFAIGTTLGIISGVMTGWYQRWNYWLSPVVKIMGVIPVTAWIPVAMIIFPSSLYAEIFLIVLCVWFPVAYMTSEGIANVQNTYFEAAKTLGANEKFLIFKVAIPGAMPSIFVGILMATCVSFTTLVVSEMIGAKAGLGWYINWAKGWSNYAKVYASIIIMAIVFSLIMALVFYIKDRILIWQKGLLK